MTEGCTHKARENAEMGNGEGNNSITEDERPHANSSPYSLRDEAQSESHWSVCPNCSTTVDNAALYCPSCRNAMPSHGIYAPIWPKESSSTRVKRLAKRIVVGLLLITLVVLASYGY